MDSVLSKKRSWDIFQAGEMPVILSVMLYAMLFLPHLSNCIVNIVDARIGNIFSIRSAYYLLGLSLFFIAIMLIVSFSENHVEGVQKIQQNVVRSLLFSGVLVWICDLWRIKQDTFQFVIKSISMLKISYADIFSIELIHYIHSMAGFYVIVTASLFLLSCGIDRVIHFYFRGREVNQSSLFFIGKSKAAFLLTLSMIPILMIVTPLLFNVTLYNELKKEYLIHFAIFNSLFMGYVNLVYMFATLFLIGSYFQKVCCLKGTNDTNSKNESNYFTQGNTISWDQLLGFIKLAEKILMVVILIEVVSMAIPFFISGDLSSWYSGENFFSAKNFTGNSFFSLRIWAPFCILFLGLMGLKKYVRLKLLDEGALVEETSGQFGKAAWMSLQELRAKGCLNLETGPIFGVTEKRVPITLPLYNTLTLGPPGLGKSLMYIATLLKDAGSKFVWDIKGELFLTTAQYRAQVLGRRVILLDFYQVLSPFTQDFSGDIKKAHRINPLDYLPEEESERDRMLTAFVAAFIIRDGDYGGSARHFDENAKILIRGYVDFIMKTIPEREKRTLKKLYLLMNESQEEAESTYLLMQEAGGHAQAAANQILRVGLQERGSIISTANRQVDWLSDSNIQEALSESTFDLRDFLKGDMDIYVVLPSEQVQEKSRLFRILLALLKSFIITANPNDLPSSKMMFLMDEIAQLGYCPDIEQFIEVMRSYKVVVWAAFQTLSQIKLYKKSDLFLNAPIKQFFTTSDVETMKWIQTLGGKQTIKTKNYSSGRSDTHQKMKWLTGNSSISEGESVHETGVDLIKSNDISEMSFDEQYIFWSGQKPIRCKKIRYYNHPYFIGKFGRNPFEEKKYSIEE